MSSASINEGIVSAIRVLEPAGGLAVALGVSSEAVRRWRKNIDAVPAERCIQIEELTKGHVRCEQLRPDLKWQVLRQPVTTA